MIQVGFNVRTYADPKNPDFCPKIRESEIRIFLSKIRILFCGFYYIKYNKKPKLDTTFLSKMIQKYQITTTQSLMAT